MKHYIDLTQYIVPKSDTDIIREARQYIQDLENKKLRLCTVPSTGGQHGLLLKKI